MSNTEGQDYGIGCRPGKTRSDTPSPSAQRLRDPFFLIGTCSTTGASPGPPDAPSTGAGAVNAESPPDSGLVEPGTAGVEPGAAESASDAPVVEHVPIKKKGARKR